MTTITITHFTDPGCPFAFSAEPQRLKLLWHYGDQIAIKTCLIELADDPAVYANKGYTPEKMAKNYARIQRQYGMPIATHVRPRLAATAPACKAVVAARLHGDLGVDERMLREFRVLAMAGDLLDEQSTLDKAASAAGITPSSLSGWMEQADVQEALEADKAHSRDPLPAGLALGHKLAPADSESGKRYTAPSFEFGERPNAYVAPGYQPFESYDAAVANILQDAALRKPPAGSVSDVLAWADYPLATAEIAALREIPIESVRDELTKVADFEPMGEDGYWTLKSE